MSYIDALFDKDHNKVHVVERVDGQRVYKEYPANYTFYIDDPKGSYKTIYDTPVTKIVCKTNAEFQKEIRCTGTKRLWESDFTPVARCLEENYSNIEPPKLNVCFFDIEVDFDPKLGYAKPHDPFNKITAISLYLVWEDRLITLAIPPSTLTMDEAKEIVKPFSDCYLFDDEMDMLSIFLGLIDEADVLSGWNSEGYDIPYTVNRVKKLFGHKAIKQFCLWDQYPKVREYIRYGATNFTYDLIGRVHLDYMQLYRKYITEERHSYSLDAICELELNERKVQYSGTLDQLYNDDFYKFIEYNRHDTFLIHKLDKLKDFLGLANEISHANTVLIAKALGAVAVTDQAIINEAHRLGMIVPNRKKDDKESKAAGAYVAKPKKGLHKWLGVIDINSLYPSTIRACNMSPETIVGQLRPTMTNEYIQNKITNTKCSFAHAWEGMFATIEYTNVMDKTDIDITIDWDNGKSATYKASEIYRVIYESGKKWIMSANGTIFSYEKKGIIPGLLERWYSERKQLQAKEAESKNNNDEVGEVYWNKKQNVKKLNLNSLYGAILNKGSRFEDIRIGQSTTLTGRSIAKHMSAKVNELIAGEYNHVGKSIVYGDTDSCVFSAWSTLEKDVKDGSITWDKDTCVELYDSIASLVNASFPDFMHESFNCPSHMGSLIKGGRELVGEAGLFIKKKRYAILMYDKEGHRYDINGSNGKLKAMGLDLKRSDTPKIVQDFLKELLYDVLSDCDKQHVYDKVRTFKLEVNGLKPWNKGTPKRVNGMTKFTEMLSKGKANLPGHVRAAINWNVLRDINNDKYSLSIIDGMKTIVCKLRPNPMGFTSIGYPIDEPHLPQWFLELPFDDDLMETTIVNQKVENLLGVLKWRIPDNTDIVTTFNDFFEFEDIQDDFIEDDDDDYEENTNVEEYIFDRRLDA